MYKKGAGSRRNPPVRAFPLSPAAGGGVHRKQADGHPSAGPSGLPGSPMSGHQVEDDDEAEADGNHPGASRRADGVRTGSAAGMSGAIAALARSWAARPIPSRFPPSSLGLRGSPLHTEFRVHLFGQEPAGPTR